MSEPAVPPRRKPIVLTDGDTRTLLFGDGAIQSKMLLSRPQALTLAYTRAMMCFLLFVPRPRRILMVGLGGGSLAKFCHRYLSDADVTVVELDPEVIAVREQFAVPPDGPRFRVIHADAVDVIGRHEAAFDVLIVDGYDVSGMPPALGSAAFYANCLRALRPGGVLVANLHANDRDFPGVLRRLRTAFDGRVCGFRGMSYGNRVKFAVKAPAPSWMPGRAVLVRQLVAATRGLSAPLNRLLAHAVVAWAGRRG
ncbi:fused MFS/spermidine synthase [Duganella sp. FT3S]|uniref:Fused MFS/spermidine synthase n=1 Tax=Rugamonas fusca TaxID=2758568 RepID=A0A7W2EI09_9BURK|nr:fused MFS/spermidine synthase [Rugamonas fusca]MBA5606294.1 fused MFS/spermidine synthase [Rugamonas fusca]